MKGKFKVYATMVIAFLSVMLMNAEVFAFSGAGSGTEADPYVITTPAQIQEMRSNLSAHYKLGNDIDMVGINHVPIGDSGSSFTGILDGDGYKIMNFTVNNPTRDNVGLFGYADGAIIKNLTMEDVNITARRCVGSLAGVFSNTSIPGLITMVENCSVSGNITGSDSYVGGLIGLAITSASESIARSYSTATITATRPMAGYGGLVGYVNGSLAIKESYFAGEISGAFSAGGLVGAVASGSNRRISAENCYSIGKISASNAVGGLATHVSWNVSIGVTNSYSASILSSDNLYSLDKQGLVTYEMAVCDNSYFDGQKAEETNNSCARFTMDMISQDCYDNWDFDSIWAIDENGSYPYLRNLPKPDNVYDFSSDAFIDGDGTEADPYILTDAEHIKLMGCAPEAHYELGADIDMAGINHIPIGISDSSFKGVLDGNGYKITNLTVDMPYTDAVGLFGYMEDAVVKNLLLEDVSINGKYYVGAIAGFLNNNSGSQRAAIKNCGVTGSIISEHNNSVNAGGVVGNISNTFPVAIENVYVNADVSILTNSGSAGGIVGTASGDLELKESYFTGSVNGSTAGGLFGVAGYSKNIIIDNCFAIGSISGANTGGLMGIPSKANVQNLIQQITNSYAACSLTNNKKGLAGETTIINSYFDSEKSEILNDLNSRTTILMVKSTNYSSWDFNSVWAIDEGESYPYLQSLPKPEAVEVDTAELDIMAGDGTVDNPYIITKSSQIEKISLGSSSHYKLGNDIDMSEINHVPIGTQSTPFTGALDGDGYKISNLTVDLPSMYYCGLFGYAVNPIVKNVYLEDVNINGRSHVGGLVGAIKIDSNSERGYIENCGVSGAVWGAYEYVGGLVGYFSGDRGVGNTYRIEQAYSTATITVINSARSCVGGLVGYSAADVGIYKSYFAGTISGVDSAGGFIGYSQYTIIIEDCFTAGNISAINNSGGFIPTYSKDQVINNSYSICFLEAPDGHRYGLTAALHNSDPGQVSFQYTDSFYNWARALSINNEGARTASEMTHINNYAGWDFDNVWSIDEGMSFPYLKNLPKPSLVLDIADSYSVFEEGNGSKVNPYIVSTSDDIKNMAYFLGAHYRLGNDIDMVGINHQPIGIPVAPFTGSFDGNGYKITNLTIDRANTSYVGLFGGTNEAELKNIVLDNVNISGNSFVGALVGGLVGSASPNFTSLVENCSVTGSVSARGYVGGLFGQITGNTLKINRVSMVGNVSTSGSKVNRCGGIAGALNGQVEFNDSYFVGELTTTTYSGLIAGGSVFNSSTEQFIAKNCYAIGRSLITVPIRYGRVQSINSYVSVVDPSTGLHNSITKTTAEMHQQSTYENWDFANTWCIEEGVSSPQLRWQMETIPVEETIEITGLNSSEITSTGMKFVWDAVDGATFEVMLDDGETSEKNTNSITYTDLLPATEYTFKVRAKVGNKYSEWAILTAMTSQIVINPPTTVTLESATATTLEITWEEVEGAESYIIDINGEIITSEENLIVLDDLTPQTEYPVKIKAVNETVQSGYSEEFVFTTLNISAPSGLKYESKNYTSITLSWNIADGAESYEISYNGNITASEVTSVELTGLTHNTAYTIKVRGVHGETKGDWSSEISVTTDAYTLDIPTDLAVTAKTHISIEVSWNSVSGAESYVISCGSLEITSTDTTAVITGLSQYREYTIKVKAINQYTESSYSAPITVRTEPTPLELPSGLIYTARTYTSITLSWNAVAGATEYEITYGDKTMSSTSPSITIENLSHNTEYVFKVMAKNEYVSSTKAEITVNTLTPSIGIPESLVSTEVAQESISLSWGNVTEADEYIVTYNGVQKIVTTNSTVLDGLLPNTDYSITVHARNQYITGTPSDSINVKTLIAPVSSVTGLKFIDRQANSITLAWNAVSGADSYEVSYGQNVISTVDSSLVITNLAADTSYTFALRALSADSTSIWSNNFTVKTMKQNAVAQNETVLRIDTAKTYDVVFTGNNIQGLPDKVFEIHYDETAIQLIDFAAFTPAINITAGNVAGTDLQIISIDKGVIKFKLNKTIADNKAWSGMFTIVKFKALKTGSTSVYFEQ